MGWTRVSHGNTIDIKKQEGVPFIGTYKGSQGITTKIGPQVVYDFDGEDGNFSIYGFTNLNRAMQNVEAGQTVRITYRGTKNCDTRFGKKDVHQVDVELFESDPNNPDERPF